MQLPGLVTVQPEQTQTIDELADIVGLAFMEEPWSHEWFKALDTIGTTPKRKLEISRAVIRSNFTFGTPYQACYMLPGMEAGTGGYLASDLGGRIWSDIEDASTEAMMESFLTPAEAQALTQQAHRMEPVTDFTWMLERAGDNDFIHFYAIGVNPEARGSGAFRRLLTPFLDYADAHDIACYLECYSDHLEGLYGHFGFKTVERKSEPGIEIVERCMMRTPHKA